MKSRRILLGTGILAVVSIAAAVFSLLRSPSTLDATHDMPCTDLNGDGVVTLADLLIEVSHFGQLVPPAPDQVDMNGDGSVTLMFDIFPVIYELGTTTDCQDKPIGLKGDPPPPSPEPDGEMSLNVKGADCDDPQKPTKCDIPAGTQFTLSVGVNEPPADGYVAFQAQVIYGQLEYKPADGEVIWPDAAYGGRYGGMFSQPEGIAVYFGLVDITSLVASTYVGNVVQMAINCPPEGGSSKIALPGISVANPWGSHFVKPNLVNALPATVGQQLLDVDGDTTTEIVDVADTLIINCGKHPTGDTDLDGCADVEENGSDEQLGGERDYLNFWDFYDVWTHPVGDPSGWERNAAIDLFGDIFGVANRFGATGDPNADPLVPPTGDAGYHPAFDRGPLIGSDPWDMGPPDGTIDLFIDIFGVANQFGHDCTAAP